MEIIGFVSFPGWQALEAQPVFKYKPLEAALSGSCDFIHDLLMLMPFHPEYKKCLVDVKIQDLTANQLPCLPHWHYDCVPTLDTPTKPEHHYLYQLGAECFTEFNTNGLILKAVPEAIVHYQRTLHRGTRATITGRRLLVRKSFTDGF